MSRLDVPLRCSRVTGWMCPSWASQNGRSRARVHRSVLALVMGTLPTLAAAQGGDRATDRSGEPPADGEVIVTEAARELHRSALVIDGHNDLPWQVRTRASRSFDALDISQPQPDLHTDIPRLRQGGVDAQFWSVYVPVDTMDQGRALATTLEQIETVKAMVRRYPETFELALTSEDIRRIHGEGKIASLIGVEGGHSIENSLQVLRQLYDLGARYMTLTHSATLEWADSATDEPKHGGLTAFGEEVVREMNRLGMLVDLSHVSPDTMRHALRISRAPLIFSHSSARGVADHPRNVPDDVLPLVVENGGVVMVNFYSAYVVPESAQRSTRQLQRRRQLEEELDDPEAVKAALRRWEIQHPIQRGNIHHVVDHIDHLVQVAGIDHVGLGADFDGVSTLPAQLDDVSTYPRITQALLDRGYEPLQIRKILGENVLRVMRRAEQVAEQLAEPAAASR